MVAVSSALYLAAGLLAVAASVGLAVALAEGDPRPDGRRATDLVRVLGAAGALTYAVGHALAAAQIGTPEVWTWVHVAGLAGVALGASPARIGSLSGLPLVIPLTPAVPAYVAAAVGLIAAGRIGAAGRGALPAALGLAVMSLGHALAPADASLSAIATVVGALLLGAWLWIRSSRRILAKLLTAFVAALTAMAILLAAVLSTVSSAELTAEELDRLGRLSGQLAAEVQGWPAEAVTAAAPLSRSVGPLIATRLSPEEAGELFDLSLSTQDFFLSLGADGTVVNSHPSDLAGSLELAITGDPLVTALREGTAGDDVGGLLTTGRVIVAFGAVAVRTADARPEDPPAGVLVTGRLVDEVWAAQQAAALDVGLVGVIGGTAAFATDAVGVPGEEVLQGLDGRPRADLGVGGAALFAAAAPIADPERGTPLGAVVATSTPEVIAAVERAQAQRLFLVSLFGSALAVVVAGLVTRRFLRPIRQLTAAAEQIGAGDLRARAAVDSPDEVGLLGAAFDEMIESLSEQQEDLSDSAAREARLRGRLESLTSSMSDGLIAVDTTGAVITFNPAAEALTGTPGSAALGRPLDEVLDATPLVDGPTEGEGPRGDPLGMRAATDPGTAAARLLLRRADGRALPVAATAAPVRSPGGEVLGRVYVLRDISRDLEVERMKTEFLANVSHELRTPITPIKGYAHVLARRDVGPDATRQFAGEILDSTLRLERIVGMIVDFAGLDSGRVLLRREAVDVPSLVGPVVERWREAHPDRVVALRIARGLPPVWGDPDYLSRCLDELLDNALKFSPGGEDVIVAARTDGARVALQVIDAGIGIDPEAAARLFTDFVQADGTETRSFGGLGLGLGLVKRIVDGIGGEVVVRSEPGQGSAFTLLLQAAGAIALPQPPSRRDQVPLPPVALPAVVPPPP